jgi:hypothetical protein
VADHSRLRRAFHQQHAAYCHRGLNTDRRQTARAHSEYFPRTVVQ